MSVVESVTRHGTEEATKPGPGRGPGRGADVGGMLGAELGRGVRSVVYALGDDRVVTAPDPATPEAWAAEELRIADSVARSGAPIPGGRRAGPLRFSRRDW